MPSFELRRAPSHSAYRSRFVKALCVRLPAILDEMRVDQPGGITSGLPVTHRLFFKVICGAYLALRPAFVIIHRSARYKMAPVKSDLPQGTLDLLMLKVIALGPVHGYAIAQRLEQVSRGVVQVPEGSLYPALHRLENRGLLAADWKETETGREAKFYRLTRKGLKQLKTETADWQRLIYGIGLILQMADGGAE